ncbi:MAG: hypothetical protein RBG13Loki_3196 [Promethearchaeota archaeon CR_4]|nr:MAG: hypothetical protein RBG13Loki_3196 [Candidatus Lokiarchaeota archaeon CR_4]
MVTDELDGLIYRRGILNDFLVETPRHEWFFYQHSFLTKLLKKILPHREIITVLLKPHIPGINAMINEIFEKSKELFRLSVANHNQILAQFNQILEALSSNEKLTEKERDEIVKLQKKLNREQRGEIISPLILRQ